MLSWSTWILFFTCGRLNFHQIVDLIVNKEQQRDLAGGGTIFTLQCKNSFTLNSVYFFNGLNSKWKLMQNIRAMVWLKDRKAFTIERSNNLKQIKILTQFFITEFFLLKKNPLQVWKIANLNGFAKIFKYFQGIQVQWIVCPLCTTKTKTAYNHLLLFHQNCLENPKMHKIILCLIFCWSCKKTLSNIQET